MKLSFILSRAKDKETLVLCYVGFAGAYRKISTKMIVEVKEWDNKRQRLKFNSPEALHLNNFFDSIYSKAITFEAKMKLEGTTYNIDTLVEYLKKVFTPLQASAHTGKILSYFQYIIEQKKIDPNFARGSVVVYQTTYKHLAQYIEKDINLAELDLNFWKHFANHLYSLNFKPNHVNKIITTTRTVVRIASDNGLEVNKTVFMTNLLTKIGCTKQSDITKVYLNESELKKIEDLELSGKLANVRDLFLIGCYTGLRFSDVVSLTADNFDGNFIKIVTKKTREKVLVPIHPVVRKIYGHGLPYPISNQKTNVYIKEVMQLAGIDKNVIVTEYKGGKNKRTDIVKMKYELIGTHTARRTFATNMYLAGDVPVHSIMKITGHRSEKSFLQYIVLENKEHTDIVGSSKFFKE